MGNPHSLHSGPTTGGDAEAKARQLTLDMCNASASEYDCIFTSGATGRNSRYVLSCLCVLGINVWAGGGVGGGGELHKRDEQDRIDEFSNLLVSDFLQGQ